MDTEFKVGITNQGDPGLDFFWADHLDDVKFAVVISKSANEDFTNVLLDNKDKIIYHAVCTGLAGTAIEPNVPTMTEKFNHIERLLNLGFPVSQIVLRIDPLFPLQWVSTMNSVLNIDYLYKLQSILTMAQGLGIKRVRYSYINLYNFVLSKLQQISYDFAIHDKWQPIYEREIQLDKINPNFEYEACAEFFVPKKHQVPCISQKDLKVLKLDRKCKLTFKSLSNVSNPACHCPINKLELMMNNSSFKCDYDCKYCYWKPVRILL